MTRQFKHFARGLMLNAKLAPRLLRVTATLCAALYIGAAYAVTHSWKEEVVLHDGSKIVAKRERTYGGLIFPRVAEQTRLLLEEVWHFPVAGAKAGVTWRTSWAEKPLDAGLQLIVFDVVRGTPYIAAVPGTCNSFERWGRPNPPYLVQRYRGGKWERVEISEFPKELERANVMVGTANEADLKMVSAQEIAAQNRRNPEYLRSVRRSPIAFGEGNYSAACPPISWSAASRPL